MPTENLPDQNFDKILDFDKIQVGETKPKPEFFCVGKYKIKQKSVFLTTGIVAVCLIVLALLLNTLLKPKVKSEPTPTPTPTPIPTLVPIIAPSFYATDSAILSLEEEIKKTEIDLLNTDLKESSLNPPALDMNIKF